MKFKRKIRKNLNLNLKIKKISHSMATANANKSIHGQYLTENKNTNQTL